MVLFDKHLDPISFYVVGIIKKKLFLVRNVNLFRNILLIIINFPLDLNRGRVGCLYGICA